jgi:hypothetical protein
MTPHIIRILSELNKTVNKIEKSHKFIFYSDHSLVMIGMLNVLNLTNY